ncbi:MAG: hypothetical protein A2Z01_02455 [Betaproteobacteria bacterium RBG_16_58_11]|nr:MAG: hypothetical protein A2Z01_02455 [Betaproteobacteria bacterium RBG_16_58_11]
MVSFGLENNDNGTDLSTRLTAPGGWLNGEYVLTSTNATFSRPASTTPDATWGAFDQLEIGITAADADVTTIPRVSGSDMNPAAAGCGAGCTYKKITAAGGTKMRYGRLRLNNAHGSELLGLPVPVRIQYFNSTGFAANSLDTCTTFSLTPAVDNSPTSYTRGDLLIDNPLKNMTVGASVPTLGSGVINLSAPGAGNSGSVDLTLDVPAWLEFNWTGVAGDPISRATFGLHRKSDQFIYQRENY